MKKESYLEEKAKAREEVIEAYVDYHMSCHNLILSAMMKDFRENPDKPISELSSEIDETQMEGYEEKNERLTAAGAAYILLLDANDWAKIKETGALINEL